MKPICAIYRIRNIVTGKAYVGSAVNVARRFKIHKWLLARGEHHSKKLQASWLKHGPDAFVFEIIELLPDASGLLAREQFYLDSTKSARGGGYNMSPRAGSPMAGVKHSEETKRKIGDTFRGVPKKSPLVKKGQRLPAEWVRNASSTHIGKKRSPEARARIGASAKGHQRWLGRKHSPESIEKMRAAHRARHAAARESSRGG